MVSKKIEPDVWKGRQVEVVPDDPRNRGILAVIEKNERGTVLDSWLSTGPNKGAHRLDIQFNAYRIRAIDADQFRLV